MLYRNCLRRFLVYVHLQILNSYLYILFRIHTKWFDLIFLVFFCFSLYSNSLFFSIILVLILLLCFLLCILFCLLLYEWAFFILILVFSFDIFLHSFQEFFSFHSHTCRSDIEHYNFFHDHFQVVCFDIVLLFFAHFVDIYGF